MKKSDSNRSIQELKDLLIEFRDNREWLQFHTPKNLAAAISIEAGELLELFLWKKDHEVVEDFKSEEFKEKVRHELADVLSFCINFANVTGIDISSALIEKIEANKAKYPVDKARNTAKKYNEL